MRRGYLVALLLLGVLSAFAPGASFAQVDGYHMTGINFNFANPGARARGIGGAFVALADDATAALANPAGLAYLDRQFTLELIHDEEETLVAQQTQGGVARSGTAWVATNDPYRVRADSSSDRINFASFVLPIPSAKMGLAFYYATLADMDQDYQVGAGVACLDAGRYPFMPGAGEACDPFGTPPNQGIQFYRPADGDGGVSAELTTDQMGVGLGWRLSDTFSIGGSISYTQTDLRGVTVLPPAFNDTNTITHSTQVDDSDLMYSIGLLYRGDLWGFGLDYRSESSFDMLSRDLGSFDGDREFPGEFRIPERLAAGVAFFPGDNWVIAAEYVHLPYSVMPDGMQVPDETLHGQFFTRRDLAGVTYASSDVDEYHLGAEYTTFRERRGWSVRVGYWQDESHLVYSSQGYESPVPEHDDNAEILAAASLFYEQLDQSYDHYTAGVGAAFGTFRFDAAVDYTSDAGTDFLLSGVLYF